MENQHPAHDMACDPDVPRAHQFTTAEAWKLLEVAKQKMTNADRIDCTALLERASDAHNLQVADDFTDAALWIMEPYGALEDDYGVTASQ